MVETLKEIFVIGFDRLRKSQIVDLGFPVLLDYRIDGPIINHSNLIVLPTGHNLNNLFKLGTLLLEKFRRNLLQRAHGFGLVRLSDQLFDFGKFELRGSLHSRKSSEEELSSFDFVGLFDRVELLVEVG